MQLVWGKTPIGFQREAIPRLLAMRCAPYNPQALLLVQGTSGGKSAVAQTFGIVDGGVTLIIVETLSLAADQRSKIVSANGIYGPVLAYQLDSVKQKHLVQQLEDKLLSIEKDSNTTVFLYTSPECLAREPWCSIMIKLIDRGSLKLVCIDEIHLYVMFGITFRKEFTLLKKSFFKHLRTERGPRYSYASGLCHDLKVPLLLMTATFNKSLLGILEKMIGVKVLPTNFIWSGRDKMSRRNICINVSFTNQSSHTVKKVLVSNLGDNIHKKAIVYTNTAACLDQLRSDIEAWMDLKDAVKGDVLVIQGDLQAEVKFISAEQFTKHIDNPQLLLDTNKFYPRILLATAGCIGAGLDSSDVYCVCRVGMPSGLIDMVQEMGRCGRQRIDETNGGDNFNMILTMEDYVYLNQRIYLPKPSLPSNVLRVVSADNEIKIQRSNLLELLQMIVLKGNCWHQAIENFIGNPIEPPANKLTACGNACPFCCDVISEYVMPIIRSGLSQFLADVFINNTGSVLSPVILVKKLMEYKDVGTVVYARPRSNKPPAYKFVSVTVLQLIASSIIELEFQEASNDAKCSLGMIAESPAYLHNDYWKRMYFADDSN